MQMKLKEVSFESIDRFFDNPKEYEIKRVLKSAQEIKEILVPTDLADGDAEGIAHIGNFSFAQSPSKKHNIHVYYITSGRAQYNQQGHVTNAILVMPPFGGNAAGTYRMWGGEKARIIGKEKLLDTSKYFVIYMDIVGIGSNSSKPSNSNFDTYNIEDLAHICYRVLSECFDTYNLKLAIGASLGAQLIYTLAYLYPHFADTIVPIAGSVKIHNDHSLTFGQAHYKYQWMLNQLKNAQKSTTLNAVEKEEITTEAMRNAWSMLLYGEKNYKTLSKEDQDRGPNRLITLVNFEDFYQRLTMVLNYDVLHKVHKIEATTLMLHIAHDDLYSFTNAKAVKNAIDLTGTHVAKHYVGEDENGHMGAFLNGPLVSQQLQNDIKKLLAIPV